MCRKLLKAFLSRLGTLEIEFAENGREAVEMARTAAYDLIFMNVAMPEVDGLEATQTIRSTEERRVPIVALTAAVMEGAQQTCLRAGMDDFLGKPLSREDLRTTLERWLPQCA